MFVTIPMNSMVLMHEAATNPVCEWDLEDRVVRKEVTGCGGLYDGDLDGESMLFGSEQSSPDAFSFPSCDFSSECTTPPQMAEDKQDRYTELYGHCMDTQHPSCMLYVDDHAHMASEYLSSTVVDAQMMCSRTLENNPYAKPYVKTFRGHAAFPGSLKLNTKLVSSPTVQAFELPVQTSKSAQFQEQHLAGSTCAASRPRSKAAARPTVPSKLAKVCFYDLCPSPLQSNKWRTVTEGTTAGGQAWNGLIGKMLCDSCYSTFRKHGTLVRSVRTADGWARLDNDGTVHRPNQTKNNRKRPAAASNPSPSPEASPKSRKKTAVLVEGSVVDRASRERKPSLRARETLEEGQQLCEAESFAKALCNSQGATARSYADCWPSSEEIVRVV